MRGKFEDLTGKMFGRLTVIKRIGKNKCGQPTWLCKCDCGGNKIISGTNLRCGRTKSCGCLGFGKKRLTSGLSNMRALIRSYKRCARKRGLEYQLTEEQFTDITQRDCFYCGVKPKNIMKKNYSNGDYTYNGIDRIDNNKGYVINNIVPCCSDCNQAKCKLTLQEFKDWIKRIYNKIFIT